jgi:F0F1-type ATP synthase assembly protein I
MDGEKQQKPTVPVLIDTTAIKVLTQVGCITFVIGAIAIFGGLWLDNQLGTRPWITVVLVMISMPIVMWIIYKITITKTRHLTVNHSNKSQNRKEENP